MLRWFVRGRNGREREIKRESVFCVLSSFWCNKKERVFGPFKNLKKRRLSPSDKIFFFVSFRAARGQNRPPVDANQRASSKIEFKTSSSAKNRRRRVHRAFARGWTGVTIRAHIPPLQKKKEGGDKKGRQERTASVMTAVLFCVGIARVDGDATLESPRAPREDKERAEKDWNNADIF